MSGKGAPDWGEMWATRPGEGVEAGLTVAVVAASWHAEIMDGLIAGAARVLDGAGANWRLIRVPGSFELPVAAARLAPHVDAVVALGVVVRGGTPHFDYVCQAATLGLTQVAANTGTPIGFGVLTCDTEAQARDRAGLPGSTEDKGAEAAAAALTTAETLRPFQSIPETPTNRSIPSQD